MANLIPEGTYRGRPAGAALGLTSKGTEQIGVQFDFTEPAGTRLTWYGFFTDKCEERTIEALRHCGWKGDDLSVFTAGNPLPPGFDQEVELVVKHEEYQGKVSARIAFINGGGGLAMNNALTADQAAAFARRMKARVGAFDKAAGRAPGGPKPAPRPAPERQAPLPASASDVPQEVLDAQAGEQPTGDVPF